MTLKVYFDGLCRVCAAEIEHYKRSKGSEAITFVDITDATFDAIAEGLDPREVHRAFHVRHSDGRIESGVDAFIAIWRVLPGWKWLVPVASNAAIKPLMNLGYAVFTKIRPWLPRKSKSDCATSPYCEMK